MNAFSRLTAILLCILPAALHARAFTDTKGRVLEGELTSVSNGQAIIKRTTDGKTLAVPLSLLSAEDQKFAADFAAASIRASFDVKWSKTRLGKTKTRQGNYTIEVEQWAYKITLANRSSADLDGLRVDYWVFRRDDDGKNKAPPRIETSGSKDLGALRKSASQDFQTNPIELTKEQLDADYYNLDGSKNTKRDSAGGLALRVFQGEKQLFEWATDKDLLARATGAVEKPAGSSSAK